MIPEQVSNQPNVNREPNVDLRRYRALFNQWWWLAALITMAAFLLVLIISALMPATYRSSTTLLVNQSAGTRIASEESVKTSELLARTYAEMIVKRPVLEKTIQRVGIAMSPAELSEMLTVTTVKGTQLVVVSVQGPDASLVADLANSLVLMFAEELQEKQTARFAGAIASYETQIAEVESQIQETTRVLEASTDSAEIERMEARLDQYEVKRKNLVLRLQEERVSEEQSSPEVVQVEYALISTEPISPRPLRNAAVAAVVGLMLSVAGVYIYDTLDDSIKDPEELTRELQLPVMGLISRYKDPGDGRLITQAMPRSPVAESFRALRTNVQYTSVDAPLKKLLITSPAPGDGKSTVAANLAMVIAQSGRRVTLVDSDMHRPRIHRIFHVQRRPGLSSLFIKPTIRLNGSFQPTFQDGLHVIGAGDMPLKPAEWLGSKKMREIIDVVLEQSDLVILDTPPVLSVTDAVVMAPMVDSVLIVVRPGVTKMSALRAAVEQLRHVGARIGGVVINGADNRKSRYDDYYNHYKYYQTNGKPAQSKSHNRVSPAHRDHPGHDDRWLEVVAEQHSSQ